MILYGRNAVMEALRGRRARTVGDIWATPRAAREPWLEGRRVHRADIAQIERRCDSPAHQGICARVGEYPYADAQELLSGEEPLVVALDQVEDPQNLGSICRTAECAGASGLVIPERRAAEVTPAVCKASAGAVEHLPIAVVTNLARYLEDVKGGDLWVFGAAGETGARPMWETDLSGGVAIVLGAEGKGLRPLVRRTCDALVSIPLLGQVESLNVSVAAALLLYEARRQRGA